MLPNIRILKSLHETTARDWNDCFANELENYDYLLAVEQSGMQNFSWCYVVVENDGKIIAVMPAFLTDYALDTTLEGPAKKITASIRTLFPKAMTLKLACLGSPVTEYGLVGFHPDVAEEKKAQILDGMITVFEAHAVAKGHRLIGMKDMPSFHETLWHSTLKKNSYRGIPGLPVASLDIHFKTMDEYFSTLSSGTRKDMRRKLRSLEQIRIEQRDAIDDVLPQMMALYRETRTRADMQFEELTDLFFQNCLNLIKDRAFCTLYYRGNELLAFNLLLKNETVLLDKFFCMSAAARDYNLYFLSWFQNVQYCLTHNLKTYQSGQAAYTNKVRLGSTLTRTTMYFRHKNKLMQTALKLAAPFLAADEPHDHKEAA